MSWYCVLQLVLTQVNHDCLSEPSASSLEQLLVLNRGRPGQGNLTLILEKQAECGQWQDTLFD